MKCFTFLLSCLFTLSAFSQSTKTPANGYPDFALGGDLSWTAYIQDLGTPKYYLSTSDAASQLTTIPAMVQDHRFDAVRLRVWVDPTVKIVEEGFTFKVEGEGSYQVISTHGRCGKDDLLSMAKTFANQGQRVMVCLQMSDTWADPARQFIPQSWSSCTSAQELQQKACEYVTGILTMLRQANVNVQWVQIGNETSTGMLKYQLPTASNQTLTPVGYGCEIGSNAQTTKNFVDVFTAVGRAAKAVYPQAKTVMHIAEGNDYNKINWTLSTIKAQGFGPDICDYIGLSLYPCSTGSNYDYTAKWKPDADNAISTIEKIGSDFGFPTLLCEIGMNNEYTLSADVAGLSAAQLQGAYIDQCNKDVGDFTAYMIENLKNKASNCYGIFYWEPETDYFDQYPKGACYSITPGASWPRDKVTANPYWKVVEDNSSFPDGGLIDYDITGGLESCLPDADATPEYYSLQGIRLPGPPLSSAYVVRKGTITKIAY